MHRLLALEFVCPPAPAAAAAQAPHGDDAAPPARPRAIVVGSARMDKPARGGSLCWYCAHPAERMMPMPIAYDPRTDVFHVMGSFCGFGCMKAYNFERNSYMKHVNATTISLFARRCTGQLRRIRPAPPRCALRAFGGTMSIDEFRGSEACWTVVPPKMVSADVVIAEQRASGRRPAKAVNLGASVDFKDVAVKNETLKLRRPKPMQTTRNALDRAMGINQLLMTG